MQLQSLGSSNPLVVDSINCDVGYEKNETTPDYYRRGKPLILAQRLEKAWENFFCCIPYSRHFFGSVPISESVYVTRKWRLILANRDKQDYEESVKVRGILNLRNLIDCFTFAWTR